mmetsp:Transcript_59209/g.138685  ORF Transcript_59209/g.138685 Transcript_59209/m.138685 type:complete len:587 (-) Transcript_59209:132-1892(-)
MIRALSGLLLLDGASQTAACTVFAVGKMATQDGSVLISHSDDGSPTNDARLLYVPAAEHGPDAKRPIYYTAELFPRYLGYHRGPAYEPNADTKSYNLSSPIGYIDQVPHTFGYQSGTYGVLNQHGVSVAESTCSAVFGTCGKGVSVGCEPGRKVGSALMSIDTLSYLAMERCRSSREAVELMGAMATKYGFYGPPDSFEGSGESLIVGDPDEAWAFQILSDPTGTSAIWAAKRLPDDQMTVVANMYTIREVDASDKDNYILSSNIFDIAKSKGWWKEGTPFDFTLMYSGGEYAHKYYSGRRMWRALQMAKPSLTLPASYEDIRYKAVYPWSVTPDAKVSHHDLMAWHRDWYAGTPFDMTKGIQAGPFGSPDRYQTASSKVKGSWERSIALYRTNAVYVQQLHHPGAGRPEGTASVAWYAAGPPHYAAFVPIPSGVNETIHALQFANPKKFENYSMNWLVRRVMDVCQIRFDVMHRDVYNAQQAMEMDGDALVQKVRLANFSSPTELNKAFQEHADKVLLKWKELMPYLISRFSDNTDIESMQSLNYPDAWLEGSGYKDGPPAAPTEDRCPPKCDPPADTAGGDIVV